MSLAVTPRAGLGQQQGQQGRDGDSQYANTAMGQSSSSESKGLKRAGPYMRGAASSFGFRKNKSNNANNNGTQAALEERNYSQEALTKEQHNVTTAIKASPGLTTTRTNRFGFRNPGSGNGSAGRGLSNKVSDSSVQVAQVAQVLKSATPPSAMGAARPATAPTGRGAKKPSPLATARTSAPLPRPGGRPSPPTSLPVTRHPQGLHGRPPGGASHLPRPQFARVGNVKDAKTAANYGTRGMAPIATFDDEIGSSKESSMNEDSGLGSQLTGDTDTLHGVDLMDVSPRSGQRLRRATNPPRRSLREEEDDPNVITEIVPIAKAVSRASLRSIASVGGRNPMPSPRLLTAKGSVKSVLSASSDEFHSDSGLFRDYGDGIDDSSEAKVYIDCKTAEKEKRMSHLMKDYGPGEEQDEDWGQGEAMAEGEWRDEVGAVAIIDEDEEVSCGMRASLGPQTPNAASTPAPKLADLVAAEHALIEDESAPEDSLFSSSAPSTSEDSPSPSPSRASPRARTARRKVRSKRRDANDARDSAVAAGTDTIAKDSFTSSTPEAKKEQGHMPSPEGSGTPSNSFSLSDGRDFLIDDEIIDQPALTIHNKLHGHGDESEMASLTESAASITLRESSHHQASSKAKGMGRGDGESMAGSIDVRPMSRDNTLMMARFGSMDSLATNSIDSEDLMLDFEDDGESKKYRSITKSWAGSPVLFWPRPRKAKSFSLLDLDQLKSVEGFARSAIAREEAKDARRVAARTRSRSVGGPGDRANGHVDEEEEDDGLMPDNDSVLLELSSLIDSISGTGNQAKESSSMLSRHQASHTRVQAQAQAASSGPSPSSAPDSPRYSLGSSGVPSPLRPPRQLASSDSDESAMMRVDRGTYQHMYQDVVHIKTMLLKLKRVLQEAETLNPFESSLKNGLLHQLVHADESGEDDDGKTRNPDEEVVDLKRQMVLMKQQMEEKDRTIQLMQVQMMKYERVTEDSNENGQHSDMCNAATQTERIRPVSAGPSLLQSLPSDSNGTPLVSWSDTWGRRSRTPASGVSNTCGPMVDNRTSSTSRVPTVTARSSRSAISGHQRHNVASPSDNPSPSPSSIPLVKGNHRKTGYALDTIPVPNARRPPVVAAPRKATTSGIQKP